MERNGRIWLGFAGVAAGALALAALPAAAGRVGDEPPDNVLVVVLDDLGWSELLQLHTPELDAFAARGTSYRRFYAMPLCSPTRYNLLFGRYGFRAGIGTALRTHRPDAVPGPSADETSLPEFLGAAGYRTAAFGKWHLSNVSGGPLARAAQAHGFDTWRAGVIGNLTDYYEWERVDDGELSTSTEYNTRAITDAALAWWSQTQGPKFAYVAYQAVHHPYQMPPQALLQAKRAPDPERAADRVARERRGRRLPAVFDAMVRALDHELGRLLAQVDLDRTHVFVISDNGTSGGMSGGGVAKGTLSEAGIRVPAFRAGPGVPAQVTSDALVQAVDLFATIALALGLARSEHVAQDSVAFGERRWAFVQLFAPNGFGERTRDERALLLAQPRYKLMRLDGKETLFELRGAELHARPVRMQRPVVQEPLAEMRAVLDELEAAGA